MSAPYPKERSALIRIQVKLDRWELEHLREHARLLSEQLDAAKQRAEDAERREVDADIRTEYWREQVMNLQAALSEDVALGMTQDGQLGLVAADGSAA